MRWNDKKKEQEIKKLLNRLKKEEAIILVEGKNDKKSLRELGIKKEIKKVSENQKPLFSTIEDIDNKYKKAIILTDWDDHGDQLSSKLYKLLEKNGIKPNIYYRNKLKSMLLKEITTVESLSNFLKTKNYY